MFFPTIGKRLLRGCQSFAGQIAHKKFECAQIGKFGGLCIVMLAAETPKTMILIRIIVKRDERICIERFMNLLLSLGRTILIFAGDV